MKLQAGQRGGKRSAMVAAAMDAAKAGGRVHYVTAKGTALLTPVIEEDGSAGVRVQLLTGAAIAATRNPA